MGNSAVLGQFSPETIQRSSEANLLLSPVNLPGRRDPQPTQHAECHDEFPESARGRGSNKWACFHSYRGNWTSLIAWKLYFLTKKKSFKVMIFTFLSFRSESLIHPFHSDLWPSDLSHHPRLRDHHWHLQRPHRSGPEHRGRLWHPAGRREKKHSL